MYETVRQWLYGQKFHVALRYLKTPVFNADELKERTG